jgi:Cupin-like domain
LTTINRPMDDEDDQELLKHISNDTSGIFITDGANSGLSGCGPSPVDLLLRAIQSLSESNSRSIAFTGSLIELATDKFYAYPYEKVPKCWHRLFSDASLVRVVAQKRLGQYVLAVNTIDKALIMAGGGDRNKDFQNFLERLHPLIPVSDLHTPSSFPITKPNIELRYPIARLKALSFESFQLHMEQSHTPIIFTDLLSPWVALRCWNSPRYYLDATMNGTRIIPIELGESYVSESFSQKLVPFTHFLRNILLSTSSSSVPLEYLAQYDLFSQIPSLRKDFATPDYCFTEPPLTPPDHPKVPYRPTSQPKCNIWMGPKGTKSPLHTDPYENIFAQVVGYKYFCLYHPEMTDYLYPRGFEDGVFMGNTSLVTS